MRLRVRLRGMRLRVRGRRKIVFSIQYSVFSVQCSVFGAQQATMSILDDISKIVNRKPSIESPRAGLYHYTREGENEKARIHLRLDADGHGALIVNANCVMHLNPTAAFMAWLILEGKTEGERVRALTARYSVSKRQAEADLAAFDFQLEELIRPDGACPIHELDLETVMPFSARPSAPYRMDLALTYRCNNDCAHCYNLEHPSHPHKATHTGTIAGGGGSWMSRRGKAPSRTSFAPALTRSYPPVR
jgi:hypothetical protein